ENGDLVLAEQQPSEVIAPPGAGRADLDVFVVNDTYLAEQEVLAPDGKPHTAGEDGRVRVLLPRRHAHLEEEVTRALPEWLDMHAEEARDENDVQVLPSADTQNLFTYGS